MNSISTTTPSCADPWRIDESQFPRYGTIPEKFAFLLRYAILASSLYNTQPWRFRVADTHVNLFADRSRWLPSADPQARQMIVACGAALFNLRTAAACHGLALHVDVCPDSRDPDWLARCTVAGEAECREAEAALLRAIPMRRTHYKSFIRDMPSPFHALLDRLKEAAHTHAIQLSLAPDDAAKAAVADIVVEAERQDLADPGFATERKRWLRPEQSERPDGIPRSYLLSLRELPNFGAPEWAQPIGTAETATHQEQRLRTLVRASPLLALLSSRQDGRAQWLAVGEALKHIVLSARNAGVWASYLNGPIQRPEPRARLGAHFHGAALPQVLLRMGYGCEPPPTARRALQDVLLDR